MRKHKPDLLIVVMMVVLMAVGLIIIYAIGPAQAQFQNSLSGGNNFAENAFFVKQAVSVVMALTAFFVAYKVPFEWMSKLSKWILVGGMLLCLSVVVLGVTGSGLAQCSLGACRWINLPFGATLQPVEILKLGVLLYMADLIVRRKKEGKLEKKELLVPMAVVMGAMVLLVAVLQKDLGSTAVMILMVMCMLVVSGMRWRILFAIGGALVVVVMGLVVAFPHRVERMMSFGGEGADTHHIDNALLAIGKGGLFGVGVGNSVQATGYLPESINDSIFAVLGETFGFVGLMAVVMGFAILLSRLLRVAELSEDGVNKLVAIGVFAWVGGHVIINIMGMTGLIPMKGITLPFLSYGGTSMMFVAIAMGICLQLSGWTKRKVDNENIGGRRRERGARYSSHRGY